MAYRIWKSIGDLLPKFRTMDNGRPLGRFTREMARCPSHGVQKSRAFGYGAKPKFLGSRSEMSAGSMASPSSRVPAGAAGRVRLRGLTRGGCGSWSASIHG